MEGRYSRPRALARALSAMGVYALLSAVSLVPRGRYADEFSAAAAIWALVCLASAMVTTDRRGLSFRLTGATVVDVRERPAKPPSQAVGAIGDDRQPRSGHGDG
ncbi:hypothetical protein GCM10010401_18050 [Rarobacter faecitabidus]|uniref:hypothetical protein n=1 Tax=Rarobacter faecitabidus TaxID=13243 RepID=UPI0011518B9A|nr:hypothetical protein [Rarobacter faecitabidus]